MIGLRIEPLGIIIVIMENKLQPTTIEKYKGNLRLITEKMNVFVDQVILPLDAAKKQSRRSKGEEGSDVEIFIERIFIASSQSRFLNGRLT